MSSIGKGSAAITNIKLGFMETRPQFLILSLVLGLLGSSIAFFYEGSIHIGHAFLACLGLLLCHASVNSLNDYFDYRSGLDLETPKTPFSGGSGLLPAKAVTPRQALYIGLGSLITAGGIGIYFTIVKGLGLLPLLLVGAMLILLYTSLITRLGWTEWAAGLGLGSLPIMGFYFIQTGEYTLPVILASIPSGILVHNLLLANEFSDAEADRRSGRRTLSIAMGYRNASIVYLGLTALVYVLTIAYVAAGIMPLWCLAALATIPWAIKASRGLMNYKNLTDLIKVMNNNVLVVLVTQALLGLGYLGGAII